ncbi:hypothetical protein J437_LFUL004495 [Ladona fulva]|uniref:Uncharacterized protein n=1 Tax=Ladona fulva TaxID=123851 RepID=A0A8K0K8Z2_LADFU|nr:hypothetical protein J437_LFUL004495 [Ladona fulva]
MAARKSRHMEMDGGRAEGGQLERELRYAEAALGGGPSAVAATGGSTHQLLIQTPYESSSAGLLRPEALLAHLDAVSSASSVTVQLFDISWTASSPVPSSLLWIASGRARSSWDQTFLSRFREYKSFYLSISRQLLFAPSLRSTAARAVCSRAVADATTIVRE